MNKMTKEEAVKVLQEAKEEWDRDISIVLPNKEPLSLALGLAIKTLSTAEKDIELLKADNKRLVETAQNAHTKKSEVEATAEKLAEALDKLFTKELVNGQNIPSNGWIDTATQALKEWRENDYSKS